MDAILTVKTKIQPSARQVEALQDTITAFSDACNHALEVAREHDQWRRFALHRLCYYDLRERFGLSANLAVQAIRRVAKRKGRKTSGFKYGSVAYDRRTLSLRMHDESISLTTVHGRERIPLAVGDYQRQLLSGENLVSVQGGQLLRGKHGKWYVHITIRTLTPKPPKPAGGGKVVGLDIGQHVLAALSTGKMFSGGPMKTKRLAYRDKRAEIRSKLDTERTRGLKRLWERLSGRERRFVRHTLHTVSRNVVDSLASGDTLAIEDLTHLRGQTTRRGKTARYEHNLWPYSMLRAFLEYKCALGGISVVSVDPTNTSRTCPRCEHCARGNRRSQRLFRCLRCGYQDNADHVASVNIARRAGSTGEGVCNDAPDSRVSLSPA